MTKEIKKAIEHVKSFHPEVVMVVFNHQAQWFYCSEYFDSPSFSGEIDVSILEDASNSINVFPNVFQIK